MEAVVLVIHLILALAIIGLVLLQRSEGGGLGIGGGGGGLGNVASAKSMNNVLTRATAICATAFFCTSLFLGILAGKHSNAGKSILDRLEETPAPIGEMMEEAPADDIPAEAPSIPIAE
ncbi:MAG: preprotein translocase subunit SecG [Alphaproteobacteria bacterium]|nr:preprotein translocase subunit SecG [Alphaproteobacteria bacterium]